MSDLLQDDTLETNVQLVSSTPPPRKFNKYR